VFLTAYNANIQAAVESVLEASPVAVALRKMMDPTAKDPTTRWDGTATKLLEDLTCLVPERTAKSEAWPGSGRALSGRLRRAASFLRRVGIHVVFRREPGTRARKIVITAQPPVVSAATDTRDAVDIPASEPIMGGKSAFRTSQPSQGGIQGAPAGTVGTVETQKNPPARPRKVPVNKKGPRR
jgi:hypothetical protein